MPYREVHVRCPDPGATEGLGSGPLAPGHAMLSAHSPVIRKTVLAVVNCPCSRSFYSYWRECASWGSVVRSGTCLLDSQPCLSSAHASLSRRWLLAPLRGPDCVSQPWEPLGAGALGKRLGSVPQSWQTSTHPASALTVFGLWPAFQKLFIWKTMEASDIKFSMWLSVLTSVEYQC